MFLSDFSIKRPIATIVLILAMMCLGLLALKKEMLVPVIGKDGWGKFVSARSGASNG